MTNEEIQQIFFVECEESLAAAEHGLAACKAGTQDDDTINGVFRAVHSVKGGAGAFGFVALQAYAHTFETLLSDVRDASVALDEAMCALLLRALDVLSDHVNSAREGGEPPDDEMLIAELTDAQAANSGNGAVTPAEDSDDPFLSAAAEPVESIADASEDSAEFELDLDSLLDDIVGERPAEPEASTWLLHLRPHAGAMCNGAEPLLLLRELAAMGGQCQACDLSQLPRLDSFDPAAGYLGWTYAMPASASEAEALELFDFVSEDWGLASGDDAAIPPVRIDSVIPAALSEPPVSGLPDPAAPEAARSAGAPPPSRQGGTGQAASSQSIRIDLGKLDRLIDTVGELVIAQAMLAQRISVSTDANEELLMLEGLTREIQESAMSIRAQPISSVFSRVPRILRELASSTGKHVQLEVIGETTELDMTVIERLGEPLTHLIRNAVDHGIENADERLAAGKPAEGTLTLSAEQRSGRILIRIADDGKGIDRARVFEKAVEKGVIAADALLSPEEIDNLIFAPGFSTAQTVTSVSGRGVGMDVVRQNVKDLGGRITIESDEGKGTTFTLALPLTLAISDGMIVNAGGQALVVPLTHVVESLSPTAAEVQGIGSTRRVLNVRGRFIPIVPVWPPAEGPVDPCQGVLIVVETQVAGRVALLVDSISDQRQFVIKSLEANYRAVEGVSGATILGDGSVALILDVDGLVAAAIGPNRLREAA